MLSFAGTREIIHRAESRVSSERKWIVWLLVLSLAIKFVLFALGTAKPGLQFSDFEAFLDYAYAYVPSALALKSGFLPYVNFYYAYTPLFLYALTVFSYLGVSWGPAIPLVLADALTVIPVYLIARRFMNESASFLTSSVFALAPLNLLYADYLWLNPPLTTLFLMVSLYCLLEGRYDLSAATLGLSIGFKQTALIAAPIMLLFLWRTRSRRLAGRYLLLVAAVCLAFSIPYLFLSPGLYLLSVFRVQFAGLSGLPPDYWQLGFISPSAPGIVTIDYATLAHYMLVMTNFTPVGAPVTLSLPVFVFLLPGTTKNLYIDSGYALTALLVLAYAFLLYRVYRRREGREEDLLRYVTCSLLLFFALYPVYKYYVVGSTPFLALLARRRRDLVAFVGFNLILIFIPRIFASYLPLVALVWLLRPRRLPMAQLSASKKV